MGLDAVCFMFVLGNKELLKAESRQGVCAEVQVLHAVP